MDASNTLVGLITQMQQLENSIASIVFELVLKLSSLTDANMFLLVENAEGRRFAGKQQMCDAYLQGALMSLGGETEVTLSPVAQSLCFRRVDNVDRGADSVLHRTARSVGVNERAPSTSSSFQPRGGSAILGETFHPHVTDSFHVGNNSFARKRNFVEENSFDFPQTKQQKTSLMNDGVTISERPEDLSKVEIPKREVDEDGDVVVEDGIGASERDLAVVCLPSANDSLESVSFNDEARPDPVSFAHGVEELDQYFAVSDKVLAVKSIPLEKFKALDSQSQSFEYKLFTSTLYDISKLAAKCSPSYDKKNPTSKAHFHNVFERVWSEFSFLELLAQLGVQPKNGFSMRNFVRATMQKTYGHILDKLLSNSIKSRESVM